MKTKPTDLNEMLFEQLEALRNDDLQGEELEQEINRAEAVTKIATQIISNNNTQLRAIELASEYGYVKPQSFGGLIGVLDE